MVKLVLVGDVHSNLDAVRSLAEEHSDADAILQVGDLGLYFSEKAAKEDKKAYATVPNHIRSFLASYQTGLLKPLPIPMYFVKGNHEDYDNLYSAAMKKLNIHYLAQGAITDIKGVQVASMGGIFSSVRVHHESNSFVGRERRFYTTEEIQDYKTIHNGSRVDVLITHQAAADVLPNRNKGWDEGSVYLKALLDHIEPPFYVHGHHHMNYETEYNNTAVVGVGNFGKNQASYKVMEIQ